MKEQFATYEIALRLKELGFDKSCLAIFSENNSFKISMFGQRFYTIIETSDDFAEDIEINDVLAPLWQQVIDWLREKRVIIELNWSEEHNINYFTPVTRFGHKKFIGIRTYKYEEAREHAILKALEIIKSA